MPAAAQEMLMQTPTDLACVRADSEHANSGIQEIGIRQQHAAVMLADS